MDPLLDQLRHHAFPDLAAALRAQAGEITRTWDRAVRQTLPQLDRLTRDEMRDNVPRILGAVSDALASDDPEQIRGLLEQSPRQGVTRFRQDYTVAEVMQEDRLLRGVIVHCVERRLGRQMSAAEGAALHATVDVMLQQGVVALVDEQKAKLRAAAEAELKYLTFLSHDLNNNLGGVQLMLRLLRRQLDGGRVDPAEAARTLDDASDSIRDTIAGMRRLLDHERLRRRDDGPRSEPVDLHAFASDLARQYGAQAGRKGVGLVTETEPGATTRSDRDLLWLVLQNLVGNAVKYSDAGTVRTGAARPDDGRGMWVLWVSDEGPGIAPDRLDTIFEAFRRGEVHGQEGVGLGLAIAAQAAKLLGAELTVESEVGKGSTFRLVLPPEPEVARRPTGKVTGRDLRNDPDRGSPARRAARCAARRPPLRERAAG